MAGGTEGLWFADAARGTANQIAAIQGATPSTTIRIPADETNLLTSYKAFDGLATGEGFVWALGDVFGRTLWKLDPISQQAVARIKLPFVPGRIAVGDGAVWVTSLLDNAIWRINPVTNRIVKRIAVPGPVTAIAVAGRVYVGEANGSLTSINPNTNQPDEGTVQLTGSPTQIAASGGAVWATVKPFPTRAPAGTIAIGLLADCEGPYGNFYDASLAGAEVALLSHGGVRVGTKITDGIKGATIAGKRVVIEEGCSDGTSASTLAEARRLVERVGVKILIGPTDVPGWLALQEYAKRQPGITFVNGTAAAQVLRPQPKTFSFTPDAAQWMAGLGAYAYRKLGWRRVVTVADADDDLFNWTQTAGFDAEFCALGGTIVKRVWVPKATQNYASVAAQIPKTGVDGVVAAGETRSVIALANRAPLLRGDLGKKLLIGAIDGSGDLGPLGNRAANLLKTAEGVGPCSTFARVKAAYGGRLKPNPANTTNAIYSYTVGRGLIFEFADHPPHLGTPSPFVTSVALFDARGPTWNRPSGPLYFASFVASAPDQVPCTP